MKIILSRKGFDSQYGGSPSPIFPDGRMISLPIPSENNKEQGDYKKLRFDNKSYYDLMKELGINLDVLETPCHVDPDIYSDIKERTKEWRHLFGQRDAAQGHLSNKMVKPGDLFLFFGTFQKTKILNGKLRFDKKDKPKHIIFGYLQIDKIIKGEHEVEEWMKYHPHCNYEEGWERNNALYVARKNLSWNPNLPGAGFFKFNENLVLSAEGLSKSYWKIPILKGKKVSYHNENSWKGDILKSASKGQEFVIEDHPNVENWARGLIEECRKE